MAPARLAAFRLPRRVPASLALGPRLAATSVWTRAAGSHLFQNLDQSQLHLPAFGVDP
jgi:hypothetical protein